MVTLVLLNICRLLVIMYVLYVVVNHNCVGIFFMRIFMTLIFSIGCNVPGV